MTITTATTLLEETFLNTSIFGVDWIIPLIIVLLSLALITRQPRQWTHLAFPVISAWWIAGIKPSGLIPILIIIAAAIAFVIDTLSLPVMGAMVETIHDKSIAYKNRLLSEEATILRKAGTKRFERLAESGELTHKQGLKSIIKDAIDTSAKSQREIYGKIKTKEDEWKKESLAAKAEATKWERIKAPVERAGWYEDTIEREAIRRASREKREQERLRILENTQGKFIPRNFDEEAIIKITEGIRHRGIQKQLARIREENPITQTEKAIRYKLATSKFRKGKNRNGEEVIPFIRMR